MDIELQLLEKRHYKLFYKWWNDLELISLTSQESDIERLSEDEINLQLQSYDTVPGFFERIIYADKEPVGHISIEKIRGSKSYELFIIIGEKEFWGKGIGSKAIVKAINEFKELFPTERKIRLEVRVTNLRAIGCYKKIGFKKSYVKKDGNHDDLLIMCLDIENLQNVAILSC